MPIRKETFIEIYDDLSKIIDVDDSRGRSVPQNMNFIEEGFLSKDTGCEYFGLTDDDVESHSLFHYKKKDGTSYILKAEGTKLQVYNTVTKVFDDLAPTYTAGARFGFLVYDNVLYGCNGVENYFDWDGTTFNEHASAPKGNVLEIFEDRMFVTGVSAEPLTIYYSNVGNATTFTPTDILEPLGTDHVQTVINYFGTLLIFKEDSIWKLTFVYDQIVSLFVPKLEIQSGNYGACSRKAVTWVENDIWFFTGREVRSIGYQDQQIGILGINASVLSEPIKETLEKVSVANYSLCTVFYHDRRFYLSVPLDNDYNDTTFVCHTLHKNNWTKYTDRIKSTNQDYMEIDGVVYTAKSASTFGIVKWDEESLNNNSLGFKAEVLFDRIEDKDFNKFVLYRYLDLQFKDLKGRVKVTIKTDRNDGRTVSEKEFLVGIDPVNDDLTLGEVPFGDAMFGGGYAYTLIFSPFQKRRVSFLEKGQAITIGLSNEAPGETFTIVQFAISGSRKPRKMFKSENIISV